ncbi:hypothetical protein OM364_22940 [Escherichia albertii]|nr:hypothetical protein [Escherichia albertii]
MLEPPKSYNEMLPMLHKATFITTFIFYLSLVIYGYMPLVGINAKYIPPVKDYEEFIKWILTFGILPIASSVFWSVISGALDLHNNVAKIIGIRKMWDSHLIIKPLAKVTIRKQPSMSKMIPSAHEERLYPRVQTPGPINLTLRG